VCTEPSGRECAGTGYIKYDERDNWKRSLTRVIRTSCDVADISRVECAIAGKHLILLQLYCRQLTTSLPQSQAHIITLHLPRVMTVPAALAWGIDTAKQCRLCSYQAVLQRRNRKEPVLRPLCPYRALQGLIRKCVYKASTILLRGSN
jgi:hypothetical protein